MTRSTWAFCQGDLGAVRTVWMFIPPMLVATSAKTESRSGAKHERAKALVEELWRDRTRVVSTQVLQEFSVNLRRKAGRPLDGKTTREVVADYLTWQVIVNGGESILDAL